MEQVRSLRSTCEMKDPLLFRSSNRWKDVTKD
jgi:hypothetical protein